MTIPDIASLITEIARLLAAVVSGGLKMGQNRRFENAVFFLLFLRHFAQNAFLIFFVLSSSVASEK